MSSQHCDMWQYLVVIFNLISLFVNFVQFSHNFRYFCSIQSQFCLYPKWPNLFFI